MQYQNQNSDNAVILRKRSLMKGGDYRCYCYVVLSYQMQGNGWFCVPCNTRECDNPVFATLFLPVFLQNLLFYCTLCNNLGKPFNSTLVNVVAPL